MRKRPSPATIIACAALFFSLGGASLAASHYIITSTSQIKPSVRHALRGERGPAGPQGQQGSQGNQGPAGAAGAPGTPGLSARAATASAYPASSKTITVAPGQRTSLTAPCASQQATGGGFTADPGLVVLSSRPLLATPSAWAWQVTAQNPTETSLSLQVWAVCASFG